MRYKLILSLFVFVIARNGYAQYSKVVEDFRSRSSLGLEKEITESFDLFAEFELGLEQDLEKIGKVHGEIGISYSPFKIIDFELKYRIAKNRKNYKDEYKTTHTFALASELDYRINRLKLYYRMQFQNTDDEIQWSSKDNSMNNVVRNRFKVKYDIRKSKLSPFLAVELYSSFGKNGVVNSKVKSIIGAKYQLSKLASLALYYRYDQELIKYLPFTYHTIGGALIYSL